MPWLEPVIDSEDRSLWAVALLFAELGQRLATADTENAFTAVTETVVARLPGADAASITTLRRGRFTTVAATDERARQADAVQYQLGSGPCVDAILERALYHPEDLCRDDRWPEYGRRASRPYSAGTACCPTG